MRAKVAIPLLLAGIFSLLLPFIVRSKNPVANVQAAQAAVAASQSTPKTGLAQHAAISSSHLLGSPETNITRDDPANDENENYVATRINELEDLGMTDNPDSLVAIESEFDNRDPRIQKAA